MRLSCALLALVVCACSAPKYTYYFDYIEDGQQATRVFPDPAHEKEERVISVDPTAISADVQTTYVEPAVPESINTEAHTSESIRSIGDITELRAIVGYEPTTKKEARKELKSVIRELRALKKDQPSKAAPLSIEKTSDASKNGLAIAGFVLSLVSLFVLWPLAIPGVILSAIGMKSEKKGLATAGLIIGIVALVLVLAGAAVIAAA